MPKMKTHSGAKKRFKVTASGKVRGRHAFTSHILEKKSPKRKRALGAPAMLSDARRPAGQADAGGGRKDPRQARPGRQQGAVMRVKRSVHARKKRRATLELTKGFRGEANSNYKRAKEALMKADSYAYRDRRNRKRDFRRLWITRINAAARAERDELLPVHARPLAGRASSSTARCSRTSPCATPTPSDVLPRPPARRRLPELTGRRHRSLPGAAPQGRRPFCVSGRPNCHF